MPCDLLGLSPTDSRTEVPVPQIRTILAATDLQSRSAAVPERAGQLARALGARLILAAILQEKPVRLRRRPTPEATRAKLQLMADEMGGLDVHVMVRTGNVASGLAELVAEFGVDLLVMGLHKERLVLDTLRLTTMEQITLAVPCPVLVAHRRGAAPYQSVLGAVTFAPASAHAMAIAARLAPTATFNAIHALALRGSDKRSDTLHESPRMTEAELLRKAFMDLPDLPPSLPLPEIIPGGVHEVIAYRISELQPDLLVIGSHSGRNPSALGNYARDLMRAPPTDLLIAKPV
jgi:nucleotide-binding universal stress UspA family protein